MSLKKLMDPVWQREFPDKPETVDNSRHVGERGRGLLRGETSGQQPRQGRAAAMR